MSGGGEGQGGSRSHAIIIVSRQAIVLPVPTHYASTMKELAWEFQMRRGLTERISTYLRRARL